MKSVDKNMNSKVLPLLSSWEDTKNMHQSISLQGRNFSILYLQKLTKKMGNVRT